MKKFVVILLGLVAAVAAGAVFVLPLTLEEAILPTIVAAVVGLAAGAAIGRLTGPRPGACGGSPPSAAGRPDPALFLRCSYTPQPRKPPGPQAGGLSGAGGKCSNLSRYPPRMGQKGSKQSKQSLMVGHCPGGGEGIGWRQFPGGLSGEGNASISRPCLPDAPRRGRNGGGCPMCSPKEVWSHEKAVCHRHPPLRLDPGQLLDGLLHPLLLLQPVPAGPGAHQRGDRPAAGPGGGLGFPPPALGGGPGGTGCAGSPWGSLPGLWWRPWGCAPWGCSSFPERGPRRGCIWGCWSSSTCWPLSSMPWGWTA